MKPTVLESMSGSGCIWLFFAALFYPFLAHANSTILSSWQSKYPTSQSYNRAGCYLCHLSTGPNVTWNAYGYAVGQNLPNFALVEGQNSDADATGSTNLQEIQAGSQPGWTSGSGNKIYGFNGSVTTLIGTAAAPSGITGSLDPAPPTPPPPSCSVSASNISPTVGTSITLTASCTNSPTGYTWVGCSSSTATCKATASAPGIAAYSVKASNGGGTSVPASININWQPAAPLPPTCTLSASNINPTIGTSINLTASCTNSPTSYSWLGCSSTSASCLATAMTAGTVSYSVIAANSGGTSAPAVVNVNWQLLLGPPPQLPNFQGLWWAAPAGSESGWGINFAHQGDIIFASWFTYDLSGKGLWLVITAPKTAPNTYAGTIYRTTGPAFNAVPFNPAEVVATAVGTGTLSFSDANTGSFAYTVGGIAQNKAVTREVFATLPSCATATASLAAATNYQDLWWAAPAGSESGWGINFTHQGDIIFATWFTYDFDHTPMWLVVTAPKVAPGVFSGTLYRTTGPPFNAQPFNPANVLAIAVGGATFTFTDGNNANFAYTVNGVSQIKAITREVFANPGTVCQ